MLDLLRREIVTANNLPLVSQKASRRGDTRHLSLLAALILASALASGAEQAPRGSRDWSGEFRENVQDSILRFWTDHAIDRQCGGMPGWLDRQGNPLPPGTKSLVEQARVLWTFASAYRRYPRPIYSEVAAHALKLLRKKMWDTKRGAFYWLVDREGRVVDGKKHLYGQSFAIYGVAEYAQPFNDDAARRGALDLFQLIGTKPTTMGTAVITKPSARTGSRSGTIPPSARGAANL